MLYASSQRLGCYLETLARFRVDLTLYAELSEIDGEDDFTPLGHVPLAWAKPRMLGSAEHDGKYADLYGSDWIGLLRRGLGPDCLELGITELDASVLQGSTARALTQRASLIVFRNAFDGIYYRSKFDALWTAELAHNNLRGPRFLLVFQHAFGLGSQIALRFLEERRKMTTLLIVLLVLFLLGGGGWGYSRWRG